VAPLRIAACVALAWLAVACVGYGLALRRYGGELQASADPRAAPLTEEGLRSYEGKLAFLTIGFPRASGVKLRIEGVDTLFYLPAKHLTDERGWAELTKLGVAGAKVSLRADPQGGVVRELRFNPGTVYQKEVVSVATALGAQPQNEGRSLARAGFLWLVAGCLLLVGAFTVTPVGSAWVRELRRRPGAAA
jgi:hypothetical protein